MLKQYDILGLLRAAGASGLADSLSQALVDHPELVTDYDPAVPDPVPIHSYAVGGLRPLVPIGPTGDFVLVFDEDFAGFDLELWNTQYEWYPIIINNELQQYAASAVTIDHGSCKLTATQDPLDGQAYTSGMITTRGKFDFRYGVAEMRARIPMGQGLWPAFWLLAASDEYPPEIDIMEHWGNNPGVISGAVFWGSGGQVTGADDQTVLWDGPGPHIFTLEWAPDRLIWYLDGIEYFTYTGPHVPQQAMYLIANLAVGGSKGGPPDGTTVWPGVYEIDYIRVWQGVLNG